MKTSYLLLSAGGLVLLRKLAFAVYAKSGPFTNNSAPPYNAAFGNNLENYLTNGVSRNGVPLFSWFGPYAATNSSTLFAHNLHDVNGASVAPDLILLQVQGGSATVREVQYDPATVTATQFAAIGNTTFNFAGLALKF